MLWRGENSRRKIKYRKVSQVYEKWKSRNKNDLATNKLNMFKINQSKLSYKV